MPFANEQILRIFKLLNEPISIKSILLKNAAFKRILFIDYHTKITHFILL